MEEGEVRFCFGTISEYKIPVAVKSATGIFMSRIILLLFLMMMFVVNLSAQTPVQKVIIKYEDVTGARNFVAQGLRMTLARKFIKSTPLAPIAQEVDELYILKMEDVSPNIRNAFVRDIKSALRQYKYYGTHPSKNGEVDIYILPSSSTTVKELVIYNPEIYSLNSLHGDFTYTELEALDKK